MRAFDGFWWPDMDKRGRPAIVAGCADAVPVIMALVPEKRVCVQAGGNVGVYPKALAEFFERVVTFEPDADNLACLHKNVTEGNVLIWNAALGDKVGSCGIEWVDLDNCGAHKVCEGGSVPMMTIDGLELDQCDLIWLDIEGHEAKAIEGARETIERFSPIIVLEEKGLGEVASLPGYRRINRIGNDTVYSK